MNAFVPDPNLLTRLRQQRLLWSAQAAPKLAPQAVIHTGFAVLDAALPSAGWPAGKVCEVLLPQVGIGELALVVALLRQLSLAQRWVIALAPPQCLYPPALAQHGVDLAYVLHLPATSSQQQYWVAEQLLAESLCGVVLLWAEPPQPHALRRLQLAAGRTGAYVLIFRPLTAQGQPSIAALRLCLHRRAAGLQVTVLKAQGQLHTQQVLLPC